MGLDDRLRGVRAAIAIGECMLEFSARPDGLYALGYAGDTYNVAVYLARSGPDLEVSAPEGTVVRDQAGTVLADLLHPGERWLAAEGGRGGHAVPIRRGTGGIGQHGGSGRQCGPAGVG